jgi:hypothetical protein
LSAATILASTALIAWLILEHKLWERPQSRGERDRAVLYNASTVITPDNRCGHLSRGALCTAAADRMVDATASTGRQKYRSSRRGLIPVDDGLLVAAVATLGGALGSGMEDDEAVKAAAYGVRQRQRFDQAK